MILFLIITSVIFIILISWFNLLWDAKNCDIRGPLPLPLVGNGLDFVVKPTEFLNLLHRFQQRFGEAVRVHLFSSRYIILFHPKYIEGIVSHSEIITKGRSYSFLRAWLGDGLLTSTGAKWRSHRKFLTPAFHFNILQNFIPVFWKNEQILRDNLMTSADGDTDVNIFPLIALAALDNVTESIMGMSFNAQKDKESKYVKAISEVSSVAALRMRNPFIAEETVFNLSAYRKIQDNAINVLHAHTKKVIEIRREELKKANITSLAGSTDIGIKNKHAFLDLLLLAEIDGRKISDELIREEVDTFMFEGHDTTTSGISFTLYCISKHKDVQEKLFNEQKSIFSDDLYRDATYSELGQMKYLEQVIKESLRLYPSVPLIERMITRDVEVAGLKLKKNTSVIVDIFHMQRLEEFYIDPMEFRPERFESTVVRNPFSWLAFSAGPRNCIGQKFAILEMKVTLSGIIRHFELFPSKLEPELTSDLILRPENGLFVKLRPRKIH
ncbi:Cytochrome P450 4d2 [Papilio machaon]|uniref:Cytochrome P450 4d2 n=1 Tax=Papilio machaon TaxID=76193 RepID=A0A194RST1_PAPMA|nr:Cytochrome P450 4d2 [Papilio machaon]